MFGFFRKIYGAASTTLRNLENVLAFYFKFWCFAFLQLSVNRKGIFET